MAFRTIRTGSISALLSLSVICGGAALAQTPVTALAGAAPVSDAEVVEFAAANKKVTEVANTLSVELKSATSEADAAAILVKGEKKMAAAIQTEGTAPARYTEIIRMAEGDQATLDNLRAKFGG